MPYITRLRIITLFIDIVDTLRRHVDDYHYAIIAVVIADITLLRRYVLITLIMITRLCITR